MSAPARRTVSAALRMPGGAGSLLVTDLGGASGGLAVAAAVGAALASAERRVLLAEIGAERSRGPTTLASSSARALEQELRELGFRRAAARGRLCWLGLPEADESLGELARAIAAADPEVSIVHVPAGLWRFAVDEPALPLQAGLLRADLAEDRPLVALAVIELRERRLPVRVASRPLGLVASRRALAGLEVGGGAARRVARLARGLLAPTTGLAAQRGQGLPLTIGAAFVVLFAAAVLVTLGGAATGRIARPARRRTSRPCPGRAPFATTFRASSPPPASRAAPSTRAIWARGSISPEPRRSPGRRRAETASIPRICGSPSRIEARSPPCASGPR